MSLSVVGDICIMLLCHHHWILKLYYFIDLFFYLYILELFPWDQHSRSSPALSVYPRRVSPPHPSWLPDFKICFWLINLINSGKRMRLLKWWMNPLCKIWTSVIFHPLWIYAESCRRGSQSKPSGWVPRLWNVKRVLLEPPVQVKLEKPLHRTPSEGSGWNIYTRHVQSPARGPITAQSQTSCTHCLHLNMCYFGLSALSNRINTSCRYKMQLLFSPHGGSTTL